jgi:hypothetical protein
MRANIQIKQTVLLCFAFALTVNAPIVTKAQTGVCDRTCLEGFVNRYLDALVARDPAHLPLTGNARRQDPSD